MVRSASTSKESAALKNLDTIMYTLILFTVTL